MRSDPVSPGNALPMLQEGEKWIFEWNLNILQTVVYSGLFFSGFKNSTFGFRNLVFCSKNSTLKGEKLDNRNENLYHETLKLSFVNILLEFINWMNKKEIRL